MANRTDEPKKIRCSFCGKTSNGYLVLPENLLDRFEEKLGFYSCTVPVFEQYVLAQLISDGSFERHINRIRRERRKAK